MHSTKNAPTTDNADFRIENNILYYVGDDAGDFEANPRAQYNIKIERYKNQEDATAESNPQIFDFIVNIKDLANSLTIALPSGDPIASGDEAGFLPENLDGSTTRKLVGTITNASGTYRLTNHDDRFEIDGNQIFYIGAALDFDDPNTPKSFALNIEHTDSNNNKQTFEYIANLKDIAPDITAYEADGTTEIAEFIAGGNVGSGDGVYTMAFNVDADGDKITVNFVSIGYDEEGNLINSLLGKIRATPKYADNNPANKLIGFDIGLGTGLTNGEIATALARGYSGGIRDTSTQELQGNFVIWDDSVRSVIYDGTADSSTVASSLFAATPDTLTGRRTIKVSENTPITEIIADFDAADTATYSLAETDDYAAFTIDANTGALTFKTAPDFETPTDTGKDNHYEITVEASDGTSTKTYNLRIVIEDFELDLINVNEGIATSETIADFDSADAGTYSLGGTDSGLFDFATATGKLNFKNIPNFNDPRDANADNIYQITIANSATSTITNVDIVVADVENLIVVYEGTTDTIHAFATIGATFVLSDDDANDFTITNGELKFAANSGDDVDNPDDGDGTNGDNRYEVTITVNGGTEAGIYNWTVLVVDTPPAPSSSIAPSAEESLPSAAESIDGDDDFALPPLSHGMDDGEAVPNKTHLNEAYYAGSYDTYVDYLQFILDGGDPSVGGLLIGPSNDETLTPDADEPTPSPEEKEEKPEQPKKLQDMLDAIGAAEQSDPHQWQPNPYTDDSDLDPINPQDPDIL